MTESKTFHSAVEFLSKLSTLKIIPRSHDASLNKMRRFVHSLDLVDIFNRFSPNYVPMIHVTGTKGKGSTSAFCESLLRHHGLSTSLYTSPHLKSIRERIRFNGICVSENLFSSAFFDILDRLRSIGISATEDVDFPRYFEYITLICFYLLAKIKPDIAIIEVGIGGLYDCTNVITSPVACIITSIGIDHTDKLGSSLTSIAYNKAGIIKSKGQVWTTALNSPDAIQVIKEYAETQNASLHLVETQNLFQSHSPLGIPGSHQYENASLALETCRHVLSHHFMTKPPNIRNENLNYARSEMWPSHKERIALRDTYWPGRCQRVSISDSLTLYLDGAHTTESMEKCCDWWLNEQNHRQQRKRILIFYASHKRQLKDLFKPLQRVHKILEFQEIYFTTLKAIETDDDWPLDHYKKEWGIENSNSRIFLIPSIHDIMKLIESESLDVLVTGSLYLIGPFYIHFDISVDCQLKFVDDCLQSK